MRRRRADAGFTLTEVMIAVALLGVGLAFITNMFLNGYKLWKRSFDEMLLQRSARNSMNFITQALRGASPGSVRISTPANMPLFSEIRFTDEKKNGWWFYQKMRGYSVREGATLYDAGYWTVLPGGVSTTGFLADHVESLSFVYPSFQDVRLIDVGITMRQMPYRDAPRPLVMQLVERVLMRNP
jgi:prepilin-type N-terminal cleavage/methylation domain-containing protein